MTRWLCAMRSGRSSKNGCELDVDLGLPVGLGHPVEVLGPALLRDPEARRGARRAARRWPAARGRRRRARPGCRRSHQQPELVASSAGYGVFDDRAAPGRAPDCRRARLLSVNASALAVLAKLSAMTLAQRGQRAVGAAHHRVLLVQDAGDPEEAAPRGTAERPDSRRSRSTASGLIALQLAAARPAMPQRDLEAGQRRT